MGPSPEFRVGATIVLRLVEAPRDNGDECTIGEGGLNVAYYERQAWAVVQLVQEFVAAEAGGISGLRLVLVSPPGVEGSLACGASKAVPFEFPELRCARVYVDDAVVEALVPD